MKSKKRRKSHLLTSAVMLACLQILRNGIWEANGEIGGSKAHSSSLDSSYFVESSEEEPMEANSMVKGNPKSGEFRAFESSSESCERDIRGG